MLSDAQERMIAMSRIDLIPQEGKFYKANLHSHCTASDGVLTPRQAKDLYKKNGYSIYAYTDHNVLNYFKELTDPEFLVLCGYELDVYSDRGDGSFWKTYHLNAIARDPERAVFIPKPERYEPDSVNQVIRRLREANYIVNYNHPGWSSQEPSDYLPLEGLTAMEIYNHGCEVLTHDGIAHLHYDLMLKHGMRLYCIATDDNHNFELRPDSTCQISDACGGWTMIKAPELSYPAVIDAFDAGHFYCSFGPEIYAYYLEDGRLCVDCSPVCSVFLKSDTIGASGQLVHLRDDITHAEFDLSKLKRNERFVRLELEDSRHTAAYTNPYYLR